jgi:competence protein ComEC
MAPCRNGGDGGDVVTIWRQLRRLPTWAQICAAAFLAIVVIAVVAPSPPESVGDAPPAAAPAPAPTVTEEPLASETVDEEETDEPEAEPDPGSGEAGGSGTATPGQSRATTATNPSGDLEVHFIDVGQGDATLLKAPDVTVLIDTGDWRGNEVVDYLRRAGVSALDLVIITHPHADHIGQFDKVLANIDVTEVWWSGATHTTQTFARALTALEASDAVYEEPRAGDRTAIGSLLVEIVNPPVNVGLDDLHDSNLALRVTYGDVRILFTGDAEAATEQRMVATSRSLLEAEIYQVGHHGSRTSSTREFLAAVRPSVVVYSAGAGNTYGHPHPEAVGRLKETGAEIYGTDMHGTVVVTNDGVTWRVATSRTGGESPAPTQEAGNDHTVTFAHVTSPIKRGSQATASVATTAGAGCNITVTYKSGPSSAAGLDPKSASTDGSVSWMWTVGSRTTAGDWPIDVRCEHGGENAAARSMLTVTE